MRSVKPVKLMSRTALLGAALAATVAVTGCSAGMVTQTDTQVPPITGTNANLIDEDSGISVGLRDVTMEFNSEGYGQGAAAPLAVRIFNSSVTTPVTFTGAESADAESVTLVEAPTQDDETAPEPTGEPGEGEETGGEETDDETGGDETATDQPQQGNAEIEQEIGPNGKLLLTTQQEQYLQVEGLSEDVNPGGDISVTFMFGDHGTVEMTVPMAMPADTENRETAEFPDEHH